MPSTARCVSNACGVTRQHGWHACGCILNLYAHPSLPFPCHSRTSCRGAQLNKAGVAQPSGDSLPNTSPRDGLMAPPRDPTPPAAAAAAAAGGGGGGDRAEGPGGPGGGGPGGPGGGAAADAEIKTVHVGGTNGKGTTSFKVGVVRCGVRCVWCKERGIRLSVLVLTPPLSLSPPSPLSPLLLTGGRVPADSRAAHRPLRVPPHLLLPGAHPGSRPVDLRN